MPLCGPCETLGASVPPLGFPQPPCTYSVIAPQIYSQGYRSRGRGTEGEGRQEKGEEKEEEEEDEKEEKGEEEGKEEEESCIWGNNVVDLVYLGATE